MNIFDVKFNELPNSPGVYRFLNENRDILYIGKATNLRQRVRSYFDNDLIKTRGRFIVDMVATAKYVEFENTKTVLDALIREAALIKQVQPPYNTREKDNRSFAYIVITKEDYPRVLQLRERSIALLKDEENKYIATYGPFSSAHLAKELLSIIRRIIPFRDKCSVGQGKPCFHKQLGLCPGVCDNSISKTDYNKLISDFRTFMDGNQEKLIAKYTKEMHKAAKELLFEDASHYKKIIFALNHINDVSLLSDETRIASQISSSIREKPFRIESYDIAHLFNTYTVGVMVVISNGRPDKSQYRKFKIRKTEELGDLARIKEVLTRRFNHIEWQRPDLIVIDGSNTHLKFVRNLLKELDVDIPVAAVVKDDRHKAKGILGKTELIESFRPSILLSNMEAHRFAVEYHRFLRERIR